MMLRGNKMTIKKNDISSQTTLFRFELERPIVWRQKIIRVAQIYQAMHLSTLTQKQHHKAQTNHACFAKFVDKKSHSKSDMINTTN